MKRAWIDWAPEELAWIEARKDWPRRELHAAFCGFWRRSDVSLGAFKSLCKRKGWLTGRTGCFPKGIVPPNKGKTLSAEARAKIAPTMFRPGQTPHSARVVGYESIDRNGYVKICVAAPNPWTGHKTHMAFKHRLLWEAENGPVPEGHRLKCLDGDRRNCNPSNWEAVPLSMAPRLNGRRRHYDTAPAELKPTLMLIAKVETAVADRKRGS